MARAATAQMTFPRFDGANDTSVHGPPRARLASCPPHRVDVKPAKVNTMDPESDEREKAQLALQRMKEKKRIRSLKMELALAESERQTAHLLEQQHQAHERVEHDPQLEELLRLRRAGVPIDEALARIEGQRKPAKPVRS